MTTKVMLPNSKVGAVIGKQGTVIKAIRDNSGAKVNISETVAGQTERVVRRAVARRVHIIWGCARGEPGLAAVQCN